MSDERLTTLEMRAAEQERVIEELSQQVAEQWATIDQLQKRVERLTQRFLAVEERTLPPAETQKPPHW